MSAWVVFSMMGIYPVTPAEPMFTFTTPTFSEIKIHLDRKYYPKDILLISKKGTNRHIQSIKVGKDNYESYFIEQDSLLKAGEVEFYVE